MNYCVSISGKVCNIIVEEKAFEGVKKIAGVVAQDIQSVCGLLPQVITGTPEGSSGTVIFAATIGNSAFLESLEKKGMLGNLKGKRECYGFFVLDGKEFGNEEGNVLVVAGSDKRGTIYGLFEISEKCGVSPLVYWGDVKPAHKDDIIIEVENGFVSKEPSVMYRGLFINDELPSFGNWAIEKFGAANAKAYDEVFKLILRLKGNYMWPAMWFEVFSEDGPGIESAKLADTYGIVMGTSHHEPLCRAGSEWQRIYSRYGNDNTWSFMSNTKAITDFWRDGLLRNKSFENIITIGMRGEDDSLLLGENATLEDNINVLKKAILAQHELIRENVSPDLKETDRMLAIYKEVEGFYYGDETTEGLKDWDELKDVIFLLSEDNFGNTRGLPTPAERNHPGGFGMYYHFDYHGGPISYETVNCTRLVKVWEQMTMAYEFGVQKLWIVNVGDLKNNEFPLCYFMDLAYDYDKWSKPGMIDEYMERFMDKTFGDRISDVMRKDIIEYIDKFTRLNAIARPETVNPEIFEPVLYGEVDRMAKLADRVMKLGCSIRDGIADDAKRAFESMFFFQGQISAASMLMNLYGALNLFNAKRGVLAANMYGDMIDPLIDYDQNLVKEFHEWEGGKWNHMLASAHTGFRNWNDNIWNYPVNVRVHPLDRRGIVVNYEDSLNFHTGSMWTDSRALESNALTWPGVTNTTLYIDVKAEIDFDYEVTCDSKEIELTNNIGRFDSSSMARVAVGISCDREKLTQPLRAQVNVKCTFKKTNAPCDEPVIKDTSYINVLPLYVDKGSCSYKPSNGVISIPADKFVAVNNTENGEFKVIEELGREGNAIKAFPVTESFFLTKEGPSVDYIFDIPEKDDYVLYFYFLGRNPVVMGEPMRFEFMLNSENSVAIETINTLFRADHRDAKWCKNVLTGVNIVPYETKLIKGKNLLKVFAGDPNMPLEKIVIARKGVKVADCWLGPVESMV